MIDSADRRSVEPDPGRGASAVRYTAPGQPDRDPPATMATNVLALDASPGGLWRDPLCRRPVTNRRPPHAYDGTAVHFSFQLHEAAKRQHAADGSVGDGAEARHRRRTPVSLGHRGPSQPRSGRLLLGDSASDELPGTAEIRTPAFGEALAREGSCGSWQRPRCRRVGCARASTRRRSSGWPRRDECLRGGAAARKFAGDQGGADRASSRCGQRHGRVAPTSVMSSQQTR